MADHIRLVFLGDVFLGPDPGASLSPEVAGVVRTADLGVANQEGPITRCDQPVADKCSLRSHPDAAGVLRSWGVDVVTLANNHMFDFGWEGFVQTREALQAAGIRYLGAGANLPEATAPLVVDVDGFALGLLTYSWGFVQTTCATDTTAGCAPLDPELMVEATRRLADEVDAVVVQPHWGYCDYVYPLPEQIELAQSLLEAGATAVVGHHSHVVQGVVGDQDRLVAYSLGNFFFADYTDRGRPVRQTRDNHQGLVLSMQLSRQRVESYQAVPTVVRGGVVCMDDQARRHRVMARRTRPLLRDNYTRHWRRYVRWRMVRRLLYWANLFHWRKMHRGTLVSGWLMLKGAIGGRAPSPTASAREAAKGQQDT